MNPTPFAGWKKIPASVPQYGQQMQTIADKSLMSVGLSKGQAMDAVKVGNLAKYDVELVWQGWDTAANATAAYVSDFVAEQAQQQGTTPQWVKAAQTAASRDVYKWIGAGAAFNFAAQDAKQALDAAMSSTKVETKAPVLIDVSVFGAVEPKTKPGTAPSDFHWAINWATLNEKQTNKPTFTREIIAAESLDSAEETPEEDITDLDAIAQRQQTKPETNGGALLVLLVLGALALNA